MNHEAQLKDRRLKALHEFLIFVFQKLKQNLNQPIHYLQALSFQKYHHLERNHSLIALLVNHLNYLYFFLLYLMQGQECLYVHQNLQAPLEMNPSCFQEQIRHLDYLHYLLTRYFDLKQIALMQQKH